MSDPFDPRCQDCPRIAGHLARVRVAYPQYHAGPVPAFGDRAGRLWIVGLAPGMHGANATGRPFTGDYAGRLLYACLHEFGYGSRAQAVSRDDGLTLRDCYITNAVKCLPPENKPRGEEVRCCNRYLAVELALRPASCVILALGHVAHGAVLAALDMTVARYPFAHGRRHRLKSGWLVDSYHCSRYNLQTRRLSETMFRQVVSEARYLTLCSKATRSF